MTRPENPAAGRAPGGFTDIVQSRLKLLFLKHGLSAYAVAKRVGYDDAGFLRKLRSPNEYAENERRRLTTDDVDRILAELGEPPTALMQPILLPGDDAAMRWILSYGEDRPTLDAFQRSQPQGAERLARLVEQQLVAPLEGGLVSVTPLGMSMLAVPG